MVKTLTVGTDQVIIGRNGALVSSKSEPGSWHVVTPTSCTCAGFGYRGHCRHIAAVASVSANAERAANLAALTDSATAYPIY